jgi:N-acyl-D-aspartate/D-glutamate deacylase
LLGFIALAFLAGCTSDESAPVSEPPPVVDDHFLANPFPSTYSAPASVPVLITNATVLTGSGDMLDSTDVLIAEGLFSKIGKNLEAPADAVFIDGEGKWLTPGLIDVHSHMGVYPAPETANHEDGNEMTDPVTAQVWAEHSIWPQDPQWEKAIAISSMDAQANDPAGVLIHHNHDPVTFQYYRFTAK